jgi:hypothetical protein
MGAVAIPAFVAGAYLCSCSSSVNGGGCYPSGADLEAGCGYCGCSRQDGGGEASADTNAIDSAHDAATPDDTSSADARDTDSPDGVSPDSGDATLDGD